MSRVYVCCKCFNPGGTLKNIGDRKNPRYEHIPGQCGEINDSLRMEIYRQQVPHLFWLPILNLGVDYDRSVYLDLKW